MISKPNSNIKLYTLTLAAISTIIGQILLLLVPSNRIMAFSILTIAYLIWCITFVLYIRSMPNTTPFHMRFAAVFVLMLFYGCQLTWIVMNYDPEEENPPPSKLVEKTSIGAALAASIMFVMSTVYPNFSMNSCYGLIGSLTLLSGALISIFKSISQHMSVAIAMVMLIIQAWINTFF